MEDGGDGGRRGDEGRGIIPYLASSSKLIISCFIITNLIFYATILICLDCL